MSREHVRARIVPTDRTDLICIACGRFGGFGRKGSDFAVLARGMHNDQDAHVGLHAACIKAVHDAVVRGPMTQEERDKRAGFGS